jgi:hypothetical protein
MRFVFRWNLPELGDVRMVSRFIWFPTCLCNDKDEYEWRWLERSNVQQKYWWTLINPFFENRWQDVRWEDEDNG